ncbi:MAG: paraquat-inducible protein A [Burkholderiaceae bacterium]
MQQEPRRVPRGTSVRCWRCRTVLIQASTRGTDYVFSLLVTGAVLFLIGNAFPLVSLEAGGNGVTTTLFGAVLHLWQQDMHLVSGLVFVTTILAPAFDLCAMLYLTGGVLQVDAGRSTTMPPLSARVLRAVLLVRPWGMLEVFMLGALVSIVKLGQLASVIVGPALYSIGALIFVLAAANSVFNPREVWSRLPIHEDDEVVA